MDDERQRRFEIRKNLLNARLFEGGGRGWFERTKVMAEWVLPFDERHPMMRSVEGWMKDGGEVSQEEWEQDIVPYHRSLSRPGEFDSFPDWIRKEFRNISEVFEVLAWNRQQASSSDKNWIKFMRVTECIPMVFQDLHWETCICTMVGAALTTHIRREPEVAAAGEGWGQLKIVALSLEKKIVEDHMEALARGLKTYDWMMLVDAANLAEIGINGGWNTAKRWRRMMAIQMRVHQQANSWLAHGKKYLENNFLPRTALIGSNDFIRTLARTGETERQGFQLTKYIVADGESKPMEELLLRAYWESTVHKRMTVYIRDERYGRSLIGVVGPELVKTGLLMFALGQHTKDGFAWGLGGHCFWQLHLAHDQDLTLPVVALNGISMLAKGPEHSIFAYRRNGQHVAPRPPSEGMQWLLDAGLVKITDQRSLVTEQAFEEMELPKQDELYRPRGKVWRWHKWN